MSDQTELERLKAEADAAYAAWEAACAAAREAGDAAEAAYAAAREAERKAETAWVTGAAWVAERKARAAEGE